MAAQKFPVKSLSKNKHVTYRHFYLANTTAQKDAVMHCHKHGMAPRELWSPSVHPMDSTIHAGPLHACAMHD